MTPEQRAKWLIDRRRGLGASDAAPAVGLSKWKTRFELYLEKQGELETAETPAMHFGNLLEPIVRQEYANVTGRTVEVPDTMIWHKSIEWLYATVDGVASSERLYEGKTARTAEGWGEPGTSEIPQEYLIQCQHAMFVTGLEVADVAVLVGGSDFRIYVVEADAELQSMLIEQERQFWAMVQANEPPPPMSAEDVKRRWKISSGTKCVVDGDTAVACELLADWKAQAKSYEKAADQLTTLLQARMEDAAELVSDAGDLLATWKNIAVNPRFDLDRFKSEQPDLYRSYLRDAAPQRRFLLKVKGTEACPPQLPNVPIPPKLEQALAAS